jgi:hypothetical protein
MLMLIVTFIHSFIHALTLIHFVHSSLGSWVAVQRKEYKLRMEGKPSRLTQERIHRLESVGFEWVVRRGQEDCSI